MTQLNPEFVPVTELSEDDIRFLVDTGRAQARLLDELECALKTSNDDLALQLARQIVGLEQVMKRGGLAAA